MKGFALLLALGAESLFFGLFANHAISQQTHGSPRTILCDEAHGCSHQFMNGLGVEIITDNGLVIAAGPDSGILPSKFISMSVIVTNHTSAAIDVIPSEISLEVVEPKEKTLHPIAPDRVARTVNHGDVYLSIMKMALKSNTVDPGQSVAGSVFFEGGKKAKRAYLLVYIAGTVYEFPFTAGE